MLDASKLKADILSDMRVELSDEFDRNFERKAFFSDKWKPRAHDYPRGSLLIVTGAMRRSTQGEVSGDGVRFTSSEPYTSLHNEGGTGYKMVRAHTRRSKKGKVYTVRAHQTLRIRLTMFNFSRKVPCRRTHAAYLCRKNSVYVKNVVKYVRHVRFFCYLWSKFNK